MSPSFSLYSCFFPLRYKLIDTMANRSKNINVFVRACPEDKSRRTQWRITLNTIEGNVASYGRSERRPRTFTFGGQTNKSHTFIAVSNYFNLTHSLFFCFQICTMWRTDRILSREDSRADVYREAVKSIVESSLNGITGTVLLYGPSSNCEYMLASKTHCHTVVRLFDWLLYTCFLQINLERCSKRTMKSCDDPSTSYSQKKRTSE